MLKCIFKIFICFIPLHILALSHYTNHLFSDWLDGELFCFGAPSVPLAFFFLRLTTRMLFTKICCWNHARLQIAPFMCVGALLIFGIFLKVKSCFSWTRHQTLKCSHKGPCDELTTHPRVDLAFAHMRTLPVTPKWIKQKNCFLWLMCLNWSKDTLANRSNLHSH